MVKMGWGSIEAWRSKFANLNPEALVSNLSPLPEQWEPLLQELTFESPPQFQCQPSDTTSSYHLVSGQHSHM